MFIFRKLRKLPPPKSSAKEGLSCHWCMSIWFAAAVTVYELWLEWFPIKHAPLYWLGMSSIAIFANQTWTKNDG